MTSPVASRATGAPSSAKPAADPSLRKAAEGFEAVMLRQMISSMRKAHLAKDMFGSNATDNFREMADAKFAEIVSSRRQFGIADMVERQFAALKGAGNE